MFVIQSCTLLNWIYVRFRCGSAPVPVNLNITVISPYFALFKNAVHSLEPTRCLTRLQTMRNIFNISKRFWAVAVRLRLFFQFTYVQYCMRYPRLPKVLTVSTPRQIHLNCLGFTAFSAKILTIEIAFNKSKQVYSLYTISLVLLTI